MANKLLNEAELLLLRQWDEAHLLEKSMERVREKYNALYAQAAEAVLQAHPELDTCRVFVTQFWGKGAVGFGRKAWPDLDTYSFPGLWLWNVRLEVLTAEDEPAPAATLWIPPKSFRKLSTDATGVRQQLLAAAQKLFTADEYERNVRADASGKSLLSFTTLSKREILDRFEAEEGQGLVEGVAAQFDLMARFVPVLDGMFNAGPPAEK